MKMTPPEGSKKNNGAKNEENGGIKSTRLSAVFIL
jgi:hypothetical protein